ncbi:MAG: hypothetical protein FD167_4724, partial [bacterium]
DRNTKILITIFLLVMFISFGVAELNVYEKVGRIHNGVVLRYGPDPELTATLTDPKTDPVPESDVLSLPLEGEIVARMNTFSTLLDITHPHVFEIPLVLFVLAHFLMRTRAPEWLKLTTYLGSFGGCVAFLAAPWLVRYISTSLSNLLYIGATTMGLTVIIMIVVPLVDMWRPLKKPINN